MTETSRWLIATVILYADGGPGPTGFLLSVFEDGKVRRLTRHAADMRVRVGLLGGPTIGSFRAATTGRDVDVQDPHRDSSVELRNRGRRSSERQAFIPVLALRWVDRKPQLCP